jgi:Ca2+/H+ antiporter, TMEM165/GDT1 family
VRSPFKNPQTSDQSDQLSDQLKSEQLKIALTTFITVFLAEIGDKTQLTTLMITAESDSPVVVFLAAAIALVLTSLLGVTAGKWLSTRVSPYWLNNFTGLSFLILAIGLLGDAIIN